MNKFTTLLTATLALGSVGVIIASPGNYGKSGHKGKYCQQGKHGKGRGAARIARMTSVLGLNSTQVKQLEAIQTKYQPKRIALRTKMQETRTQLRQAMQADKIDKAKVKQLAKASGDIRTRKIVLRAEIREAVHNILTPEQRAKKKTMRKGRYGRHHGHKGHHGHHHH